MKESQVHGEMTLPSHQEPSEVAQPRERPLDLPAASIPPQRTTVLGGWFLPVTPMRRDQFDRSFRQTLAQRITVVGLVRDHALRLLAWSTRTTPRDGDRRQGRLQQVHFRRRGRVQVDSQRNTLTVDHHHPLCAFPPLGFAHSRPPFFAEAKLPSANVSFHLSRPRWSSVDRNVRQRSSQTSCSSQSCRRRQHVDGLGYLSGRSCQRAPVRKIQRIASNTGRFGAQGRPPFLDLGKGGSSGSIRSHCLSVKRDWRRRRAMACPPSHLSHTSADRATPLRWL